jgi:hypothetical protein
MNNVNKPLNLLICVTFHYVSERLTYLQKISSHFSSLAENVEVIIITNERENASVIFNLLAEFNLNIKVISPFLLGHPYLLTWCHIQVFREALLSDQTISHFLYLEDDMCVTAENISYWIEGRERLRRFGLIPSFFRFELCPSTGEAYSTDVIARVNFAVIPKVEFQDIEYAYLNLPSPYQGMYFLDRELMNEHLESQSSSPDFGIWSIREKAAQGITFLKVPEGFTSRNLIGYSMTLDTIDSRCLVYHIANNYITNPDTPHAKIRVADLIFVPSISWSEKLVSVGKKIKRLIRRPSQI